MAYSISDKLAIALACLAGVMAIILFLVEKTQLTIICLLLVMALLLVYPVLHFFQGNISRFIVFAMCLGFILLFGRFRWPPSAGSLPDITITGDSSAPLLYDFKLSKSVSMATMRIDTKYMMAYRDSLNLLVILRAVDDSVDVLDDARIEKSETFEITGEVRSIQLI